MYIRKIGAMAGLAAGAAFALAPLASADPVDITSTVGGEVTSLNSLFDTEATLAGDAADIVHHAGSFDTIPLADAPQTAPLTTLDYELYGVNPLQAGPASDPGSFELFNGALGKFDDAYNVLLYAALNNGAIDPNDGDFIGSASSIDHAQSLATALDAAQYFYNFGVGDLEGYFGIFPQADTAASDVVNPLSSLVSSEITSANSLFSLGAELTGVPSADIVGGGAGPELALPTDVITTGGEPTAFGYFLFGLNPLENASSDPNTFDLFNGAVARFDDALNFGVYALENGGQALPAVDFAGDLFGNTGTLTTELTGLTASAAITDLLTDGVKDLLGYFDIGSLMPN